MEQPPAPTLAKRAGGKLFALPSLPPFLRGASEVLGVQLRMLLLLHYWEFPGTALCVLCGSLQEIGVWVTEGKA